MIANVESFLVITKLLNLSWTFLTCVTDVNQELPDLFPGAGVRYESESVKQKPAAEVVRWVVDARRGVPLWTARFSRQQRPAHYPRPPKDIKILVEPTTHEVRAAFPALHWR